MSFSLFNKKIWLLAAIGVPLLLLFAFVVLRAGPLAPINVTLAQVESRSIAPALFGIGTVEARYAHKMGPTLAGRLMAVHVQPGEMVRRGQALVDIDPVDLDDKISAQDAALERAQASIAALGAQIQDVSARKAYAQTQATRYEQLWTSRTISQSLLEAKRQDLAVAQAGFLTATANREAALKDLDRLSSERDGLLRQRANLRLTSPVDGLVTRRDADPGTTVVAGQTVVEIVEPSSFWVNARFDQQRALGLRADLDARIELRSQGNTALQGRVVRIEPYADPVTEEVLAKIVFSAPPEHLPPIGELAEVTLTLTAQPAMPVVLNASLHRINGRLGVWVVEDGALDFRPVQIGVSDLEGYVQILSGLKKGEQHVVYSQKALKIGSRINSVTTLTGAAP